MEVIPLRPRPLAVETNFGNKGLVPKEKMLDFVRFNKTAAQRNLSKYKGI